MDFPDQDEQILPTRPEYCAWVYRKSDVLHSLLMYPVVFERGMDLITPYTRNHAVAIASYKKHRRWFRRSRINEYTYLGREQGIDLSTTRLEHIPALKNIFQITFLDYVREPNEFSRDWLRENCFEWPNAMKEKNHIEISRVLHQTGGSGVFWLDDDYSLIVSTIDKQMIERVFSKYLDKRIDCSIPEPVKNKLLDISLEQDLEIDRETELTDDGKVQLTLWGDPTGSGNEYLCREIVIDDTGAEFSDWMPKERHFEESKRGKPMSNFGATLFFIGIIGIPLAVVAAIIYGLYELVEWLF